MRSQFWIFLLVIWTLSFLILLPATQSPWHGLERELLAAPTASLRSLDLWSLGKMAPGEFLGWWSLLEQRRWTSEPLTFRLVNLFLVSAIVLFFALALAGENLRHLETQPDALFAILPASALLAFHPYLSDLVANAFARPVLLAGFWGFISFLLLRRAFAEQVERPGSLAFGVLFFLVALACHPAAAAVLAALAWPLLTPSKPLPRNWIILILLALVSVIYFVFGLVWAQSPTHFFCPEFFFSIPEDFRNKTFEAMLLPVSKWHSLIVYITLTVAAFLGLVFRRRFSSNSYRTRWAWHLVFFGMGLLSLSCLIPFAELPETYLVGPLLVGAGGYGLIEQFRKNYLRPTCVTRAAAGLCGFIAVCFLILASARSWSYNRELSRARAQVAEFPEWSLAWRDYGLALVGDHRTNAGLAVLTRSLSRFPEDWQTRLTIVETALEKNLPDPARTTLDQLRQNAPERWEVVFYLCALAARQGEPAEAEGYCQAAADERPASALALNYLATVRLREKRFEDAAGLLEQARKLEPRNASVQNNLGYVAEQQQDLDRALRSYQEAARLDPDQALYLKNAAHLYYLRQQIPEAIASLERAVRIDSHDVQARANLAQLFFQIQDLRRAQDQIIAVLRIAPDSPEAEQMRRLLRRMGQTPPPGPHPRRRMR